MRLAHPFSRALVSLAVMLVLSGALLLPWSHADVLARPLLQVSSPQLTPAIASRDTTPGTTISFDFTLTNVGATQDDFTLAIEPVSVVPGVTADLNIGSPVRLAAGASRTFSVVVNVPTTASVGSQDVRRLRATANASGASVTSQFTTRVVSPTPTATISPTPSGTAGPSPTSGPLCRDRFEPNDSLAPTREIRPDEAQTHAICPQGDEDWMFFGGVSGKVYTIDVTAMDDGLDLSLSLYDEAGNLLAFNDDFPRTSANDIRPRIQSWRVPVNGRYYIKVRDNAGRGGPGLEYTILLDSESYGPTPTLVAELCTDLFEPDGVPEEASDLVIREVQPNHKFCPTGDADWVRFFAKAGQPYVLRVTSGVAGADPVMILVDRDGASILDLNDDSGGTLDPRIEFQVAVDGFYFAQLKNIGDVGSQFISYSLFYEPLGVTSPPAARTPTVAGVTPTVGAGTPTSTGTPTGTTTARAGTPTIDPTILPTIQSYPVATQTAVIAQTQTAVAEDEGNRIKGQPVFVNGHSAQFVDPAFRGVWARTDQVVASRAVDRSWMWGPEGLVARAETYSQANGGARQVQYFDKARMEITDWSRDRANPWFVTNGLLVKELIEGKLQIGDAEFVSRSPAMIGIAGDANDATGPTYASFARHLAPVGDRVGQVATATLARDGSTGAARARDEARLAYYVPETGHNIPRVFWDFLQARGPVGNGQQTDRLVDWVFAMGYPVSEAYWTKVKVGGVERDVLVQAFQRRVLTYTPSNPAGWQVEMGNVGRHYYAWRYGQQP